MTVQSMNCSFLVRYGNSERAWNNEKKLQTLRPDRPFFFNPAVNIGNKISCVVDLPSATEIGAVLCTRLLGVWVCRPTNVVHYESLGSQLGLSSLGDWGDMSEVIFSCPTMGRGFNSGFHATGDELRLIPAGKKLRLRCPICGNYHEFDFAAAGLCTSPNFCRERKNCQQCPFAIYYM